MGFMNQLRVDMRFRNPVASFEARVTAAGAAGPAKAVCIFLSHIEDFHRENPSSIISGTKA